MYLRKKKLRFIVIDERELGAAMILECNRTRRGDERKLVLEPNLEKDYGRAWVEPARVKRMFEVKLQRAHGGCLGTRRR